jgi:hypothetical protein
MFPTSANHFPPSTQGLAMKATLTRRHFFEPALGTVMLLLLPGCGGGDSGLADAATASTCGAQFDFNHGHVLVIQKTDLDSPTAMTYDITGTADHAHTVTFSLVQLAALKAGASVTVTSTTAFAHQHLITVSCL